MEKLKNSGMSKDDMGRGERAKWVFLEREFDGESNRIERKQKKSKARRVKRTGEKKEGKYRW